MGGMRLVIIESPFAGRSKFPPLRWLQQWLNVRYARKCVRDALERGEAPIASHLLYTQPGILRDQVPEERARGIEAGLAWRCIAAASVVYVDRGVTKGMRHGIRLARNDGIDVELRRLK